MPRRGPSKLASLALAVAMGVAGLLVAGYFWRLEIATRAIARTLQARGVIDPELRVTELHATGVTIRDVRLGEPAVFEAAQLRVTYDWWHEPAGLRAVAVEGARWHLDLREGAAIFGALQQPVDSMFAPAAPAADDAPSIPHLAVTNSVLELETAAGPQTLGVALELRPVADGELEGRVELTTGATSWKAIRLQSAATTLPVRIRFDPDRTSLEWQGGTLRIDDLWVATLHFAGPATAAFPSGRATVGLRGADPKPPDVTAEFEVAPLRILPADGVPDFAIAGLTGTAAARWVDDAWVGNISTRGERVELVERRVALQGFELDLPLPSVGHPVRLSRSVLRDLEPVARFPPVGVTAALERPSSDSDWQLRGRAELQSRALTATVVGTIGAHSDSGDLRIAFEPVRFARGGLQPEALFPGLGFLREVDGRVDAAAHIAWTATGLSRSEATIRVADLDFRGPTARVDGLNANLELTSLLPLGSAPHQELAVRALHTGGLRFDSARAKYQLLASSPGSPPLLHVEAASLQLGRGSLRVVETTLDPAAPREFTVLADQLRLEELARLLDVAEIAGTGTISGVIPVRIEDEAVRIHEGVLQSEGPGVLSVRPEFARKALESAGETAVQLGRALEDFRYERLRITLEKPFHGTSVLGIHVLGQNPAVLEGQPFDVHINIETDLDPLLRAASLGLRIPGEWSRRNSRRKP